MKKAHAPCSAPLKCPHPREAARLSTRVGLKPWDALRVARLGFREMWLLDGTGGRFWFWRPERRIDTWEWEVLAYAVVRP